MTYSLSCCGVSELENIRYFKTSEEAVMDVDPFDQAFVIFTEVQEKDHESCNKGRQLRDLIEKEKLGVVVTLPLTRNPNTSNRVKPYLWKVHRSALSRFRARIRKENPEKYGDFND